MEDGVIVRKIKNPSEYPLAKYKAYHLWQAVQLIHGREKVLVEASTKQGLRRLMYQLKIKPTCPF